MMNDKQGVGKGASAETQEIRRVYGQFSIETIHERRKRLAHSNRKTKCQNYRKISRN